MALWESCNYTVVWVRVRKIKAGNSYHFAVYGVNTGPIYSLDPLQKPESADPIGPVFGKFSILFGDLVS